MVLGVNKRQKDFLATLMFRVLQTLRCLSRRQAVGLQEVLDVFPESRGNISREVFSNLLQTVIIRRLLINHRQGCHRNRRDRLIPAPQRPTWALRAPADSRPPLLPVRAVSRRCPVHRPTESGSKRGPAAIPREVPRPRVDDRLNAGIEGSGNVPGVASVTEPKGVRQNLCQ